MQFSVEFYQTRDGKSPVEEFLNELERTDPDDFAIVLAGLNRLRNRHYHRPPLSKPIGDGLFELRHVGKLNTRVLYFFMKGQKIITVQGIRNKGWAILDSDRKVALARKQDWMERKEI